MGTRTSKRTGVGGMKALDAAIKAFETGDFEAALATADLLLTQTPDMLDALHLRADTLVELGRLEEAGRAFGAALKVAPDDLGVILGAADLLICGVGEDREAVEEGLGFCAKGKRLAQKAGDVEMLYEFLLLEGTGLNQMGEGRAALESLETALEHMPHSVDAQVERGAALFELCRFDEAKAAFDQILKDAPDEAWAHQYLGLMAERRGDEKEAQRRFAKARALQPKEFLPPVELGEAEFDRAVEAAIQSLPHHVKQYLDHVTIAVEAVPADDDLQGEGDDPPLSPSILGVFRGLAVTERGKLDRIEFIPSAIDAPPAIVLYQKNLERFARSREELIEQIGITVMHEVGHLMGLDEDDLWQRGLD